MNKLYSEPIKGISIIEPVYPPRVDDILLGYEIVVFDDDAGCFVKPRPSKMNTGGWLVSILLAFICWPAMCVPCCLKSSYDTFQRPVYGHNNI